MDDKKEAVVIAEDSVPNQKILEHLLTKLGYNVIPCSNGLEAWTKLNEPENNNVVAILSDLMMPEKDGLTLLSDVRKSETLKDIPFVLITAVADRDRIVEAKNLKVNGYILKPVTFQRVTAKMQELFPNKKFPKAVA